jgi:hypothetical protein
MPISRRAFLGTVAAGALLLPRSADGLAFPWKYRKENHRDPASQAYTHVLTDGASKDELPDQAQPIWTRDMRYVLFNSDRPGVRVPHAQLLATGQSHPLAREVIDAWVLSPPSGFVFMLRGRRIEKQLVDAAFIALRKPWRVADLPPQVAEVVGGLSMDADGRTLYAGVRFKEGGQWGIVACDTNRSLWRTVAQVGFKVGQIQAHPTVPALILFSHATDGDAPQRMWVTRDNTGVVLPMFTEWYNEWVIHGVWWGHRVLFTIWPENEERLKAMHGIVSLDLKGSDFKLQCRYPAWHTQGSPDGKWILGDDSERTIWIINPYSGERRLLAQGDTTEGIERRPRASFTADSRGVIYQSTHLGKEVIMVTEIPEWDALPATS